MTVRRSLAWIILSQGSVVTVQFLSSVVLARLLTPLEMGVYAIAAATIGILTVFQSFGLVLLVVREATLTRELLATAFTVNTCLSALLALGIVLSSFAGGALFRDPGVRQVMMALALVPLIGIVEFLPAARLEREGEFRKIGLVGAARAFVSSAATVGFALAGFSSMSMAWGGIAGALASALLFTTLGRSHVSFQLGLSAWRAVLRFGTQQFLIQGINTIAARVSEVALGRLLGLSALGLYGRASNLNNLFYGNVNLIVGRVLLVDFAEQSRRGASLRATYLRVVDLLTVLLWPCFAGLAILSVPFVGLVYGEAWLGAAVPLSALAVSSILLVSITMTWEVFVVCNETDRQVRLESVRTSAGLVFFLAGACVSVAAAAAGRVLEAVLSLWLYRPHLERMTQTHWSDFAPIYARNAMLTGLACGPSAVLMIGYDWSAAVPLGLIAAAVITGVLAWSVALWLTDHLLFRELRVILRGRLAGPVSAEGFSG